MKRLALTAIRFYQRRISPGMSPSCRFQPTCSHYACEAIETFGAVRGSGMAAWRILRCNPLNDGGFDPVPERAHRDARSRV
ncbi:MAG: membrane protein insertion efficiency factor YidD [Dehalococcoidia bacterium]